MANPYEPALNYIITHGYEFRFTEYFRRGFSLFIKFPFGFLSYGMFMSLIVFISGLLGLYGGIISNLLQPVLLAGVYFVANDILREQKTGYNRFFTGFEFFGQLLVLQVVIFALVFIGLILLIIPGVYFAVSFSFSALFVVFLKYDFKTALEWSRKIVGVNFWPVLGFMVTIGCINILGALAFGIGLMFTLPFTACVTFSAFEDIVSTASQKVENFSEA